MPADRGGPVAAGRPPRPSPPPAPHGSLFGQPINIRTNPPAPRPRGAPPTHTDVTSSGPDYGRARANAYKQTSGYRHAVASVFKAQPTRQKIVILAGLARNPYASVESKIIGQTVKTLDFGEQAKILAAFSPKYADLTGNPALRDIEGGIAGLGHLLDMFRGKTTVGGTKNLGVYQGGIYGPGGSLGKNVASDTANLLGSPITTAATVGQDITHPGKLTSDLLAFPKALVEHPAETFAQHPVLSAATALGGVAGATRLAAGPVRAFAPEGSTLGRAVSTKREGVLVTGNLTHERPQFSKSPYIKHLQAAGDKLAYERGPSGKLEPRTPFQKDRLVRSGVGQLFSVRERIRRANRDATIIQREKAIRPPLPKRAGHAAKNALTYDAKAAVIPGTGAYARLADLTVRHPTRESFIADLQKHLEQVSANRPNLRIGDQHGNLVDHPLLAEHDQYVKGLQGMLKRPPTTKQLGLLAQRIEEHRQQYAPVQEGLRRYGHFGADMTREALQRRELMHYAVAHMGAKFDAELGLVNVAGHPLSTTRIIEHLNGPEGTGGRMPLYTPDHPQAGSAYYHKSERLPLPQTARNTLFAYTHGLTDPGHEAMIAEHVSKQGVLDAYNSKREYMRELVVQPHGGWKSYRAAKEQAVPGQVPINISEPFHPKDALEKAYEGIDPAHQEELIALHGLDLTDRLKESRGGRWGLIDRSALDALKEQEGSISPAKWQRAIRGLNTQFRSVVLSTSAKHVPGVAAENLIRDIGYGIGFRSWLTGRRIAGVWEHDLGKAGAREQKARLAGGQQAGMTEFGRIHSTAESYRGTALYPVLKSWEAFRKTPGVRQTRTLWLAWTNLVIKGVKKALEEQHQMAVVGKQALQERGYAETTRSQGFVEAIHRLLALHGSMLEDAARGLYDPAKARQARAGVNRVMGNWTDLTPTGKAAVMYSPFGLWWINSVRFLAHMPIDQPVKTGLLASATAATQKRRQAQGLDILGKGALPPFELGGIPAGNSIIAQNYYSPFGVINNPLETGASLIQPWLLPLLQGAGGVNFLWKKLSSPGNPRGHKDASLAQRGQYMMNSLLSSFVPLYSKAQQILAGGQSQYDVTNKGGLPALKLPTKKPGSIGAGLRKAVLPIREYKKVVPKGGSSGGGGSGMFGDSGSGSSSGGGSGMFGDGGGSSGGGSGMFK